MTETNQEIQLVKGIFLPIEAADVLFSLITDKIKFHNLQLLNVHEISEKDIEHSMARIEALKEAKGIVKELILKARNEGYKVKINGNIEIQLIKIEDSFQNEYP